VKRVPRNEGFFLFFAGDAVVDMVEERGEGNLGAGVREDESVRPGKPGDPGPLSTSEGEVVIVETVAAVLVVTAVPMVLVDCPDPTDR